MLSKVLLTLGAVATVLVAADDIIGSTSLPGNTITSEAEGPRVVLRHLNTITVADAVSEDGSVEEGGAEFITYGSSFRGLSIFAVNANTDKVDVYKYDIFTSAITLRASIDVSAYGSPQSVAFKGGWEGVIAVAVAQDAPEQGSVLFYNVDTIDDEVIEPIRAFTVGVTPDHVSFNRGCLYAGIEAVVAGDRDPYVDESGDAYGGVAQICARDFADAGTYPNEAFSYSFESISDEDADLIIESDIISSLWDKHDPTATQAQLRTRVKKDLEPEYLSYSQHTISYENRREYEIYCALQDNNAIAIFTSSGVQGDLKLKKIVPLGFKDFSAIPLDLQNDKVIDIRTHEKVVGMYQPDAIKAIKQNGKTYLVLANEGSGKEVELEINGEEITRGDENKVKQKNAADYSSYWNQKIDENDESSPIRLTEIDEVVHHAFEGRVIGTDGTKKFDTIYSLGTRSFSVWDPSTGDFVHDSGSQLEDMMAKYAAPIFNADDGMGEKMDKRSTKKGSEPESLAYGKYYSHGSGTKSLLFVGLERPSLIGIWDVSDITKPVFHSINAHMTCDEGGDDHLPGTILKDPEALEFIPALNILIASGAVSSTLSVFKVVTSSDPSDLNVFNLCDE